MGPGDSLKTIPVIHIESGTHMTINESDFDEDVYKEDTKKIKAEEKEEKKELKEQQKEEEKKEEEESEDTKKAKAANGGKAPTPRARI